MKTPQATHQPLVGLKPFAIFLALGAALASAEAADKTWTSGSAASWSGTTWNGGAPPASGDSIVTPSSFGGAALDTSPTLTSWTYNSSSNWAVSASGGSRSLTISSALSKAGTGTLNLRSAASSPLGISIGSITASAGELRLGDDNNTNTQLSSLDVSGLTSISGGSVSINSLNAQLGEVSISSGSLRIYRSTGGSGGISVSGLSGSGGFVASRENNNSTVAGTLTLNGSSTYNYGGAVVNAVNAGTGSGTSSLAVKKEGSGTQTFSGNANIYSGGTTINSGTLLVANTSGSGLGTGAVDVNSGGTLGGTGIIALSSGTATLTVGANGKLLGGDGLGATGVLSINNNVILSDSSRIVLTLGAGGASSSIARLGGTWTFDSDGNQTFEFINAGAELTTYTNLLTGLDAGLDVSGWTVSGPWSGSFSNVGGNISYTVTAIPEPSTAMLLGLSAGALILRRNRRQSPAVN